MRVANLFLAGLAALLTVGGVEAAGASQFTLGLLSTPGSPDLVPIVAAGDDQGSVAGGAGSSLTLVVGLDAPLELFGYALEVQIDDAAELILMQATQLACLPDAGGCTPEPFKRHPVVNDGRASVFSLDALSIAGDSVVPPGLFSLTFQIVGTPVADGIADVRIGLLDAAGNSLTLVDSRGFPLGSAPTPGAVGVDVVPEPATAGLFALGILGLALRRRGRGAAPWLATLAAVALLPSGAAEAQPTCNPVTGISRLCDDGSELATPLCQCRDILLVQGMAAMDFVDADEACQMAVAMDPGDDDARFFQAWSRVLRVLGGNERLVGAPITDSIAEMLDGFDVCTKPNAVGIQPGCDTGRNLYDWDAGFPKDLEGDVDLPGDSPRGSDVQRALADVLVPALRDSIADLGNISQAVEVRLCPVELATISDATGIPIPDDEIEIDFGDVKLFQSAFALWMSQLLLTDAYDQDLDLDSYTPITAKIRLQDDVIDANPNLLRFRPDRAPELEEANDANRLAADAYIAASNFIRGEGGSDPVQDDDLFTIEPPALDGDIDTDDELEVRQLVASFRASLDAPTVVLDHDPMAPSGYIHEAAWLDALNRNLETDFDERGAVLDLGLLYDIAPAPASGASIDLRAIIPFFYFESSNEVRKGRLENGGSYPDHSFGGVLGPVTDGDDYLLFLDCVDVSTLDFPACQSVDLTGDGFVGGPDFTPLLTGMKAEPAPPPPLCGIGFELALVLPPLVAWRRRKAQRA